MAKSGDVCCSDCLGRAGLGMLRDSPRRAYPSLWLSSPSQASPHKSHGWVPSIVSNFHAASSPILQFPPLPPCALLGSPAATAGSMPWVLVVVRGQQRVWGPRSPPVGPAPGPSPLLWVPHPRGQLRPLPGKGRARSHAGEREPAPSWAGLQHALNPWRALLKGEMFARCGGYGAGSYVGKGWSCPRLGNVVPAAQGQAAVLCWQWGEPSPGSRGMKCHRVQGKGLKARGSERQRGRQQQSHGVPA